MQFIKVRALLLFFLSAIISNHISGQNTIGLPRIINYNKSDFQAGSQTYAIKEGNNGIMYFANSEGLLTFDGNHWKIYPLPNKTIIRSLFIDKNNTIYVGGQNEFGYFTPNRNGSLEYVSLKNNIPKNFREFADIWNIEQFGEALFFRATDRIFELKNNSIEVFPSSSEWRFMRTAGSKLIAQDKDQGLLEFKNNGWYPMGFKEPFDHILISGILKINDDSILISTLRDGLFILSNDKINPLQTDGDKELTRNLTYSLEAINNKEFVAGTTSNGCLIINYKGEIIQQLSHAEGLQNNNVLCLFRDKNNNLWAGLNNGISFIDYNSAIKYIQPNKINQPSGYSTIIFNKQLYIATSDGTYTVPFTGLDKDLSFSKGNFLQIKNSSGQVWKVDELNNHLLMGYNDGIFEIRDNEAFPIMNGTGAWIFAPTKNVFPSNRILVGTYVGLKMLGFSENKFQNLGNIQGVRESFRFLAIDNNNIIWTSHPYRGVYRITLSPDQKTYNSQLLTEKDGLPSSLGNYVFKVKNQVVFATEKGVFEYDSNSQKFVKSAMFAPVFGDIEVRYLKESDDGNIWFCSEKKIGVVRFNDSPKKNENKFTITYFPELTGQILSGFENIYPFNKNNIFIGSENGVIHLNYEKYISVKSNLMVLLSQVKAIGESDTLLFGGYFQTKNQAGSAEQNKDDILKLHYSFNNFHFEYSSPNYGLQKNIEYSYRLNGYDEKWSEWSPKTEKDYTNLGSGKYTFVVKARDNLSHESESVSYSFILNPAWYVSNWAKFLYLLSIAACLVLLFKWQQKKWDKQQRKFEEEQRRLKELHQLKIEKNEKEIIKLQNEKLANEVKFKSRELANANLHLVERSDALSKVKDELQLLFKKTGNNHDVKKTLQLLNDVERNNSNWDQFANHFDEINNDFLKKIKSKYPSLSKTDLKVCAYLQLNLSSKEIAQLMNISVRGVEIGRYRLRKKLQISKEKNLTDFLNEIN
ncbi:MAG: triple tyrosine motif-containing protein [Ginsengibacter sp.]